MRKIYYAICLLTVFIFVNCSGSKKYYKKGQKLETAQMFEEATQMYQISLQRKRSNIDAKISLKRTGQIVLDRKLGDVFKGHASGEYKSAVYAYLEATKFNQSVEALGVKLSEPPQYKQYFEESKEKYLNNLYEQGVALLEEEKFEQADKFFAEIQVVEPDYKDVTTLKRSSANEPLYRNGKTELEAKNFKAAYRLFDKIYQRDKSYKDVADLREQARKEAALTISLLPFRNLTSYPNLADKVQASVTNSIINAKSPFIEVVDRENLQAIIEEQKLSMTGLISEESAAKLGELLGVKAVLIGKVTSYSQNDGVPLSQNKTAYESYMAKRYDTATKEYVDITKYRPTNYREYSNSRDVSITFQYQLVSSETGKVLLSDIITQRSTDEVRYATYQGNISNLFPVGLNNQVSNSRSDRERLIQMLNARRELKPAEDLIQNIYTQLGNNVAGQIQRFVSQ